MRLTLRTLLSWKDGMLEGEAARDLAARIEASDTARALVQRIDEVVSRPTLSAPGIDATGFAAAANTAAEYLDNVLPPEELNDFERVCFASEAQLAETAGTHEMLAIWSREPANPLDAAARRRLLEAVRTRAGAERVARSAPASEAAGPRHGPVPRAAEPVTSEPVQRRVAVPSTRPASAPISAWLMALTALVLLAALIGMLGWSLTKGGSGRRPAAREIAAQEAPAPGIGPRAVSAETDDARDAEAAPKIAAPPKAETKMAAATPDAAGQPPVPAANEPALPEPTSPVPVASGPVPPTPPEPAESAPTMPAPPGAVERRVPQGAALAIAAPAAPAPRAVQHPEAAPTGADRRDPVVEGRQVVLERPVDAAADAWRAGADGTSLDLPVDLIAPPWCRPTIVVDGVRIRLEPGTRATLDRDADGTPRLEVVFGAAALAGAGRVGLTAGGLAGVVTVAPAAPVGVGVKLERDPGAPAEAARRSARMVSASGPLSWQPATQDGGPGYPPGGAAAAHQAIEWRSGPPATLVAEAASPAPSWLTGGEPGDPVERLASDALAARLAAGTAAVPALRELAGDRRSENRLAAAAALALVGEFGALARLLTADGPDGLRDGEWSRLEAIAVQRALDRGPRAADAFARAVAAHLPPDVAETVVRFARGFSAADLEAGAADELVAALESPHLVVRRYAVRNLVAITGDDTARSHYRADWTDEARRAKAAAWWRARLAQGRIRNDPPAAGDR